MCWWDGRRGRAARSGATARAGGRSPITLVRGGAGFVVEEDRFDDGGHVSAYAGAVVVEDLGNPIDVSGAGGRGDEALDELTADERADVGVVEDVVERDVQLVRRSGGGLAGGGGDGLAVEQEL